MSTASEIFLRLRLRLFEVHLKAHNVGPSQEEFLGELHLDTGSDLFLDDGEAQNLCCDAVRWIPSVALLV
jgi:hypothetical protein